MKVLITGGAGFIGSHLGHFLIKKKHDVKLLDNLSFGYIDNIFLPKSTDQKPHFIKMDIRDKKVNNVLKNIDIVFHFAGHTSLPECQSNPDEAYAVNVAGTLNIIELARRNNVKRIIFSSTSAVYENETSFPILETATSRPSLTYSLSKTHAEELCESYQKLYNMDIVTLRFFNVYGPHMDFKRPNPPLISYLIHCFITKQIPVLHSNGKQARDMIYVDDVLNMCEKVMTSKHAKNQIFNVGFGKAHTVKDIYTYTAKAFGATNVKPLYQTATLLWDKYPELSRGVHPFQGKFLEKEVNKYTLASIKKAKKLLNWTPQISLEKGIQKTVSFAVKNK